MKLLKISNPSIYALLFSGLLAACGGGTDSFATNSVTPLVLSQSLGAPAVTGDTATDSVNWINYRRAQTGLSRLTRNSNIDAAAWAHSNYQNINQSITHVEVSSKTGFTGVNLNDCPTPLTTTCNVKNGRLSAANYALTAPYAAGEVISAANSSSGFYLTEQLITAIYHRFIIFNPSFKELGAGASSANDGFTYLTDDFTASNGYGPGIGSSQIVIYPFANQTTVPTIFFPSQEEPDPVPNQNTTGYPISVHADISTILSVSTFTVQLHGGASLPVKMLTNSSDSNTPAYAAAIIPLSVLNANSTYDVTFIGTANNIPINRTWSFTTQ